MDAFGEQRENFKKNQTVQYNSRHLAYDSLGTHIT